MCGDYFKVVYRMELHIVLKPLAEFVTQTDLASMRVLCCSVATVVKKQWLFVHLNPVTGAVSVHSNADYLWRLVSSNLVLGRRIQVCSLFGDLICLSGSWQRCDNFL